MADPTMFAVSYEDRDYSTGANRPTKARVEIWFKVDPGTQLQYANGETYAINTSKPFRGVLEAGVLEALDGNPLELVANTAELDIDDDLYYTIKFLDCAVDGVPVAIQEFDFPARTDGTALDLNTVSPTVVNPSGGVARGEPVYFVAVTPATDPATYRQIGAYTGREYGDPVELSADTDDVDGGSL